MKIKHIAYILFLVNAAACAPLLDADFDALSEGNLTSQIVDLPGSPQGDRMIVSTSNGSLVSISDSTGSGDNTLFLYRNVLLDADKHSEIFFDPIDASGSESIFFSWDGNLMDFPLSGSDEPVVAIKLRNLAKPDVPNLFSKLVIRIGPEKITAATPSTDETSIGQGVTGSHKVILRIDPQTNRFAFFIGGDGVIPDSGFTYDGTLDADASIDPDNIGITITFADELNFGNSMYVINNAIISQWQP